MGEILAQVLTWIMGIFIALFGDLLLFLVEQLIEIATYNKFVNSTAVVNGWVIVRDLCNMFFVVVLLAIAIATILKIEMYHYKKLLGRLVIMAIVINFSKTIAGIIIDFSQVLTLTFVNGFKAAAGGNFVQALGLDKIMALRGGEDNSAWQVAGAYALALIMLIVSCVVVGVMLAVFLIRMVMLWILIVLSPLAFFLTTFPQGQKYASQWWSEFGNYVLVGPVMAFFLWLSLISVSTLSANDKPDSLGGSAELQKIGITEIGSKDSMQAFIIAIGMLIGSLSITAKMGIMGSSLAGAAVTGIKKAGMAAVRKPVSWAGKKAGQYYNKGADLMYGRTGLAMPGSKLRTEMKDEREKTLHRDRLYKGQAVSADRVAGGRVGIMMAAATLMDPGLARKMGTLGVLKMAVGVDKSKKSLGRYAELQKRKADVQRLGEDPVGAYQDILKRDQKTETEFAGTSKKEAEEKEKKAEELRGKLRPDQVPKIDQLSALGDDAAKFEKTERESLTKAAELGKEMTGLDEEIGETQKVKAELDPMSLQGLVNKFKTEIPQEFGEKVKKHIADGWSQGEAEQLAAQDKKSEVDQKLTDLQTRRNGVQTSKTEAERVGAEAKGRLEVTRNNINTIKSGDKKIAAVFEFEEGAKAARRKEDGHKKRAKELGETAKLEGNEFAAKAREHFTKLASAASFVDAASFVSTPEGQTLLKKIQDRAKRELTEELGREPTDDEIKQKRSDVMKKMAATSA